MHQGPGGRGEGLPEWVFLSTRDEAKRAAVWERLRARKPWHDRVKLRPHLRESTAKFSGVRRACCGSALRNENASVESSAASSAGFAAILTRATKGTTPKHAKRCCVLTWSRKSYRSLWHESPRKARTRTRVCSAHRWCLWCQMQRGQQFSHRKMRASEREHGLSRENVSHGLWPLESEVSSCSIRGRRFLVAVHIGAWMTLAMAKHKGKHEVYRRARPASLECKTSPGASMTLCTGVTAGRRSERSPQHAIETVEETLAGGTPQTASA